MLFNQSALGERCTWCSENPLIYKTPSSTANLSSVTARSISNEVQQYARINAVASCIVLLWTKAVRDGRLSSSTQQLDRALLFTLLYMIGSRHQHP
jgi:hypothetical protein